MISPKLKHECKTFHRGVFLEQTCNTEMNERRLLNSDSTVVKTRATMIFSYHELVGWFEIRVCVVFLFGNFLYVGFKQMSHGK